MDKTYKIAPLSEAIMEATQPAPKELFEIHDLTFHIPWTDNGTYKVNLDAYLTLEDGISSRNQFKEALLNVMLKEIGLPEINEIIEKHYPEIIV